MERYQSLKEEELQKMADEHLEGVALDRGIPISEWDASFWEFLARFYLETVLLLEDRSVNEINHMRDFIRRWLEICAINDNRIKGRKDQIDKCAFQVAAKENLADYATKSAAIRDLRKKPQFANYSDDTLREWLKSIWDKPTKRGAPKKLKT